MRLLAVEMLLVLSACVALGVATYVWRARSAAPGAGALILTMLAVAAWSLAYRQPVSNPTLENQLLWARVVAFASLLAVVAYLVFVIQYTGRDHWLTPMRLGYLLSIPAMVVVLAWTNHYHELVWVDPHLRDVGEIATLSTTPGPAFAVALVYANLALLVGSLLILSLAVSSERVYQGQAVTMLAATAVPWVGNVVYYLLGRPFFPIDPTPLLFSVTGVIIAVALYRYHMFDLIPVAPDAMIESLRDGVVVLDRHDRVSHLNPAARNLFGVEADFVGRHAASLLPAWEEFETVDLETTHREELWMTADGEAVFLSVQLSPLYDFRDRLSGRILVLRDATERRRRERELEQFTAAISHDLRSPLRTTEQYLGLLEDSSADALDEDGRELLTVARENSQRMQTMLTDLLRYSRVGSDGEFRPVDCDRVVSEVLDAHRFEIEERDATVVVEELPTVSGVEHLLRRLFQNLLGNALTYSEGEPEIKVSATRHEGSWRFRVRDEGVGMAPAEQEQVFELFTRGADVDPDSGTGMGLAICKKIVEHHGGSIEIASRPDEGTTVAFTIPDAERRDGSGVDQEDGTRMDREAGTGMDWDDESGVDREDGTGMDREDGMGTDREDGSGVDREDAEADTDRRRERTAGADGGPRGSVDAEKR